MKILLISKWVAGATKGDFYYPGVWRDTFEFSKALVKKGCEVAILTSKIETNHRKRFDREFGNELTSYGIKHFIVNTYPAFGRDWGFFRIRFFIAELKTLRIFKPNVIQYMQFGPSILYIFAKKTPVIFYSCYLDNQYPGQKEDLKIKNYDWGRPANLLSDIFYIFQNMIYLFLSKLIGSSTLKEALRRNAVLVFMHKKGYKRAIKEFNDSYQLYFIQKGINFKEIQKQIRNVAKNRSNRHKQILFLGSIFYGKGIFDLLKSFKIVQKKIQGTKLVIVGSGPLTLVNKLKKYINDNKLKAVYYGSISYRDKWKYYLNSDIFCLPSYIDSYPSVIFEAAITGLPVVTTSEIDSPVINNNNGLLVPAGDINKIVNAIITLLTDDKLRRIMSKNIQNKIGEYSWENAAENFIKLYRRFTNNRF